MKENAAMNKPDFYTACASTSDGVEVALPEYASYHVTGVLDKVLEAARREGFKGTAMERMAELGWRVGPAYLRPASSPIPAWEPLTPERQDRLKSEPLHAKYWLACYPLECKHMEPAPVIGAINRLSGRVYFDSGDEIYELEQISHIMGFITPELPKA